MTGARVVLITAPTGEPSTALARALVESRVAACVNVIPGVRSCYRWEGAVQEDAEDLLVAKTSEERLPDLIARVQALHPYTVPEVLALPVEAGNASYLQWVLDSTRPDR